MSSAPCRSRSARGAPSSRSCGAEGLTVELVADSDAAHAVQTVNLLLLGADTVFRDGSLVNKVGTRDLTKAAKEAGVPVVVACEVLKMALRASRASRTRSDST